MIKYSRIGKRTVLVPTLALTALTFATLVSAQHFGDWDEAVNVESIPGTSLQLNSPFNDGCPIQSPDGLSLFFASNRLGVGGLDIWVSTRESRDAPWGDPINLEAINSLADDFCPMPARGHRLYFVSAREFGCGGTANPDIYTTRLGPDGWEVPVNIGCHINSPAGEASPSLFEDELGRSILYFSSTRTDGFAPGGNDFDIYFSVDFGTAQLVPGLNTEHDDARPNVRKDGREVVFDSNRPTGYGLFDIWTASRDDTFQDWNLPTNAGPKVNSLDSETRPSLSWDGKTMFFGSNRPGSEIGPNGLPSNDIYVTTRSKQRGN